MKKVIAVISYIIANNLTTHFSIQTYRGSKFSSFPEFLNPVLACSIP